MNKQTEPQHPSVMGYHGPCCLVGAAAHRQQVEVKMGAPILSPFLRAPSNLGMLICIRMHLSAPKASMPELEAGTSKLSLNAADAIAASSSSILCPRRCQPLSQPGLPRSAASWQPLPFMNIHDNHAPAQRAQ